MKTMEQSHLESEIALVITRNGMEVSRDLARRKSILQYTLRPGPVHIIKDTYFDTLGELLRGRRTILRVRNIDHLRLITVKSNPKKMKGMGVTRTEIELPWSRASLAKLAKQLRLKTKTTKQPRFSGTPPSKVLQAYDLYGMQERKTVRKTRNVYSQERRDQKLAEISIDDTTFIFGRNRIRMNELEIEAKNTRSFRLIQNLAGAITELYPDSVRYWVHGKFVTGLAIQRLFENGTLQTHLNSNKLRSGAFPFIDKMIRARRL